ncbi:MULTISPECIES: hypothetical protein [unclassified Streptomyces]|uniref:hypothetical protein n=1 Tax=unclassified Streptomyces TaxID=2593676 RepID=UPI0037F906BF
MYAYTAASLPFLVALTDNSTAPGRASIIALLLSIGRDDDSIRFTPDGTISTACTDGAAMMRERADAFVTYAADADLIVRHAAIEGLGLFLDDADHATEILRGRLPAASGTVETRRATPPTAGRPGGPRVRRRRRP